jgi:hypothetical protein
MGKHAKNSNSDKLDPTRPEPTRPASLPKNHNTTRPNPTRPDPIRGSTRPAVNSVQYIECYCKLLFEISVTYTESISVAFFQPFASLLGTWIQR